MVEKFAISGIVKKYALGIPDPTWVDIICTRDNRYPKLMIIIDKTKIMLSMRTEKTGRNVLGK